MINHALVDADSIVYGVGFTTEEATEAVAASQISKFLEQLIYVDAYCETYDMWITGKDGNFRNDYAVTAPYKGQRPGKKPKHYDFLRDYLVSAWDAKVSSMEEADDCVSIASYARDEDDHIVCSLDKDLDNIRGHHYCWRGKKKGRYHITEEQALLNFYTQILVGDKIDNIIGIKGIGPVKAARVYADVERGPGFESRLYAKAVDAYGGNVDRVIENGRLLWLRREEGQIWQAPSDV